MSALLIKGKPCRVAHVKYLLVNRTIVIDLYQCVADANVIILIRTHEAGQFHLAGNIALALNPDRLRPPR